MRALPPHYFCAGNLFLQDGGGRQQIRQWSIRTRPSFFDKDGMVHKLAIRLGHELPPDHADAARPPENADQLAFGEIAVGGLAGFELRRKVFRRDDGPQTIREVTHMLGMVALGRSGEAIVHQRLDDGENLRICHF